MALEGEDFSISGPFHLTSIDWTNVEHQRSVAASLVQSVYVLERDRQLERYEAEALAPPWWEFFHFKLIRKLVDDADFSVFGGIFEFKPLDSSHLCVGTPRYVIAFRGTVTKPGSVARDFELDLHIIRNGLQETSRFEIAIQAVKSIVASVGELNVWLTGHSLGAAMAMLAGKTMAKQRNFIQSYLFNPPFFSAPIETIQDKRVAHGLRVATSVITAGLAIYGKKNQHTQPSVDPFVSLSEWVPNLFVNPDDHICSEYIGYFEHRKRMDDIGIGAIERLATQNSLSGLLMTAMGTKESEPLHLIPSAVLSVNLTPCVDFKEAHGLHQWWRSDLHLQSKLHEYK